MPKRQRTGDGYYNSAQRGAAIGARYAKKYPYSQWGTQRFRKGTMVQQAGASYRSATPVQRAWRKQNNYYGQGGYFGRLFGKMAGGLIGAPELGSKLGDKAGDALWNWTHKKIKKRYGGKGIYTGMGEYDTRANALVPNVGNTFTVPQFHESSDGVVVTISHKEYIGDVYGPAKDTQFSNQYFEINPGLKQVFPWLSQIAANYDEYELDQCIFTYKSTVADFAAASGQVGQIITATQYNAMSQPFTDKRAMMEYDASESAKTSTNIISGVECDPDKLSGSKGKYVRTGPTSGDKNDYDHGVFNIAVHDVPDGYAGIALGELWVSYTITLRKPKLFTSRGYAISNDQVVVAKPTVIKAIPFGDKLSDLRVYACNNLFCKYDNTALGRAPNWNKIDTVMMLSNNTPVTNAGVAGLPALRVTFPGNLEGNFEVIVNVSNNTSPAQGDDGFAFRAYALGNIRGILDLYKIEEQDMQISKTSEVNSPGLNSQCLKLHIRISQSTDNVDNVLFLYSQGSPSQFIGIQTARLSISQYNTICLKKQDGSDDNPKLVNLLTEDEEPIV